MYLGLDLGTTNIKALLVDDAGVVQAEGSAPVKLIHVDGGGIEQDIEDIWRATCAAIRKAGETGNLSNVRAVGVSSQGAAMQIRTRDGKCLGPVISWMDARGAGYAAQLDREKGAEWFIERTGHGAAGISVGHVLRLKAETPKLLDDEEIVGFVGDTIVQRLCGRAVHHGSSLSICGFYNPSNREADGDVLASTGLRASQWPGLASAREPAGSLTQDAARATSLPPGVPVSVAVHDQYAAALGCGALEPGDVMFGAGTAWVLLAVSDRLMRPAVPSAYVCDHVVPDRWGQMFSMVVGGSVFNGACAMAGLQDEDPARIDELIASTPAGCDGLIVLPFHDGYGGYRRPGSGSLFGLKLGHGRGHLVRGALEGLCCELARQLAWLMESGWPVRRLIMCGGAARSKVTPRIVADVTGAEVVCPHQTNMSALGAAMLARGLVEPGMTLVALQAAMRSPVSTVVPGRSTDRYRALKQEYTGLVNGLMR